MAIVQFEQHIHFLKQNAVIPHEKKRSTKYQLHTCTAGPICYVFTSTFEEYLCKVILIMVGPAIQFLPCNSDHYFQHKEFSNFHLTMYLIIQTETLCLVAQLWALKNLKTPCLKMPHYVQMIFSEKRNTYFIHY